MKCRFEKYILRRAFFYIFTKNSFLQAIILEVMDKSEPDSLKVMIFMIEGILPECYFTDNLRGLSVDMAVFRDLLKVRIPRLSQHLDNLQKCTHEGAPAGKTRLFYLFSN